MAQQTVSLQPGESKVVTFEATPHEARAYQVSVDGLSGSFVAVEPPPPEFVYTTDLIVEDTGSNDIRWTVGVQNIGEEAGELNIGVYQRMKAPYTEVIQWSGFSRMFSKAETLSPGEEKVYTGTISRGPYTYQVMVKSEAGVLLNPRDPLEFICTCCGDTGILSSFATQEELDAHYAVAHPEYAPMEPLTHFLLQGLSWPDDLYMYGDHMGKVIEWGAAALRDENDYESEYGWDYYIYPTVGNVRVGTDETLEFVMPDGWVGARRGACGRMPNSTRIRLWFKTDDGWSGFLGDSPWLYRIPDGGLVTFSVGQSGPSGWSSG